MARVHFFFLSLGLSCLYCPVAWADKASPKSDGTPSSTPPGIEAVPPKSPEVPTEVTSSNTKPQQPTPATPAMPNKPAYLAETMRMQRAWMYSAIIPGWGQIYNQHYWKVPAMYALWGALGWGAVYNHQVYHKDRQALRGPRGSRQLEHKVDYFRRNRDLCLIFMGFLYVANIFDAYAGASLKTFNLSDDISVEVQPDAAPITQEKPAVGLSLTFKF